MSLNVPATLLVVLRIESSQHFALDDVTTIQYVSGG